MTDEDRQDHEEKADELERELDDMQDRSGRLEGDIEGAGEDWEQKKRDPGVPGAPEPVDEESEGDDVDADQLDFGRDVDKEDVVGEAPPEDDDSEDDSDESDKSDDDESDDSDEDDDSDDSEDDSDKSGDDDSDDSDDDSDEDDDKSDDKSDDDSDEDD
jgi:hypothetical protein